MMYKPRQKTDSGRGRQKNITHSELLDYSLETIQVIMTRFIRKINDEDLSISQQEELLDLWEKFIKIQDSYYYKTHFAPKLKRNK